MITKAKFILSKKVISLITLVLISFYSYSQCTNTTSYGSATASTTTGTTVQISSCQYQSEYSTVSGIIAGNSYSLTNSAGGCITIHSGSYNGPTVAFGNAPLAFNPGTSGTYYVHYTVNCGSCTTASPCSTTSITTTTGAPPPPAPANNECNTATIATVNSGNACSSTTSGTVTNATASSQTNGCGGTADDDVWYRFQALGTTENISLNNLAGSTTDMYFSVYSGSCAAPGAALLCSDPQSASVSGLTIGNWYYIRVFTWTSTAGQTSTFDLCITTPTPAVNNECTTATPAVVNPDNACTSSTSGTLLGATASAQANGCSGTADDDVWFSFVALGTSQNISLNNVTGSTTDLYHSVYAGTCGSLGTALVCSDPNTSTLTGLTIGNTYYVRVYSWTSTAGQTSIFDLCITTPPPPPSCVGNPAAGNTACLATPICELNGYCGSTAATYTANSWSQLATAFCGSIENNSFISFTASAATISFNVWITSSTMGYGIQIYIFSAASCNSGAVTGYTCWNPGTADSGPTLVSATGLTPGAQYYIMIDGNAGDVCNYIIGANSGIQIPVDVTPASSTICLGQSVTLNATGGNGSYTWSPATGLSATTGATVTATPPSTGSITYTATSSTGNPLCPASTFATTTITVNSCGCTVTAANTGPICAGSNFNITSTAVTGATGYSWSGPGGYSSNVQNPPAIVASAATAGIYTVTVTTPTSTCTSSTTVVVNNPVTPTFAAVGPYCSGSVIPALPTTSTNGITGTWSPAINNTTTTLYTFTPTAGQCATTTTMTITITPKVTPTFTPVTSKCSGVAIAALPTTSTNGITGTWSPAINNTTTTLYTFTPTAGVCANTTTMTIIINPLPIPTAIADSVNCNGGSTGFVTVTGVVNSPGGFNYSWNTAPVQATQTATGLPVGTYTVTVTDQNTTCTGQTTATIFQPPVLTASDVETNVSCIGGTNGNGAITATGGTAPYNVSWTGTTTGNPVGNEIASSGGTYNMSGLAAGTYNVTVTDANGCTATTTVNIAPGIVMSATFTINDNTQCLTGNSFVFTNTGSTGVYSWNFGDAGTSTLQNPSHTYAAPGTYVVTHTVTSGPCFATTTQNVTVYPMPLPVSTSTPVSCFGGNNGTATVTTPITPGPGPFSYSWAPGGQISNPATGLTAGSYTATVTDVTTGCTGQTTVVVATPPVLTASDVETNVSCVGGVNGNGAITATGGTAPYNISWTGTTTGNPVGNEIAATGGTYNISGLGVGTYNVTVTDAMGCTATTTVNIADGVVMTAGFTINDDTQCLTGNTFVFTNTGSIGVYSWNFGDAGTSTLQNPSHTYATAGTYVVTHTVTSGSCSATTTQNITVFPMPLPVALADSVNCNGGTDGLTQITNVTNSAGPFNYSWNSAPVQTTQTATGLPAGSYTCVVTDQITGCTGQVTVTVFQPPVLTVTETHVNPTCNGFTNGTATATGGGGTSGYSYSWNTSPVQNTQTATGLVAGSYTCTITDANGCQQTVVATLTQPAPMVLNPTMTPANCGLSDGSSNVTITSGGVGPYTYSWNTIPVQNTQATTNVSAGTYSVIVTDQSNGCTQDTTITVSTTAGITATAVFISDALCNGVNDGKAYAFPTGGSPIYTYSWNTIPIQTNDTLFAGAGTYTVVITDGSGCTGSASVTINEPTTVVASITGSTNLTCFGTNDGTATAAGSGGTGAYTYSWNTIPVQTTQTAIDLSPGTYTVTVTDGNGCTDNVAVTILDGIAITAGYILPANQCLTGNNFNFINTGTTGGFTSYSWNFGDGIGSSTLENPTYSYTTSGTFNVQQIVYNGVCADTITQTITVNPMPIPTAIADSVLCNGGNTGFATVNAPAYTNYQWDLAAGNQTTNPATNLTAGTYTVTVTDANGCQANTTATVFEPTVVTATETHVNPLCAQGTTGSATATPTGGTTPYTYSWNTAPVQTTATATGLAAGSYICTITDYNGCTTTTTAVLVDPAGMILNSVMTQANCGIADGSATVGVVSGGSGNFSYSWNTVPVQNTVTASNISTGTYIATVTDVTLGCISSDTIFVSTTSGITATTVFIKDALCNGSSDGMAYAFPTGGAPIYTYSWNTVPIQTTDTVTAGAGTYTVSISDGSGCAGTATVTIGEPTLVVALITGSTDETSLCANDGTATAGGLGGTGVYTYSWNTTPVQNTQTAIGLAPGTYTVTVTDGNLCPATTTVTINSGIMMTASHTSTNVSCFGGANGSIDVTVSGAPGAVTYNWMPGSIGSEDPIGLTAGTYILTATSLGCSVNDTVIITQPTQLVAAIDSVIDVTCNGGADGHAHGSATGGTGAYTYSWNTVPVQNTSAAFGLPQGIYTLTVTDGLGCQSTINATIIEPAPLAVNTGSISAYCGVNQGTVWAFPTNGTAPYTYIWDSSAVILGSTDTLSGLYPGSYHLQVLDNNGCKFIGDVVVSPAPGGSASISATTPVSCFGGADGTATVSMSGAYPPYSYQWDAAAGNQITNPAIGLSQNGPYGVNVTDSYGCVMSTTAIITQPAPLSVVMNAYDIMCFNSCNAQADAIPSGGAFSSYTYQWNDPASQALQTATGLCPGMVSVIITDANGCSISDSVLINDPAEIVLGTSYVAANCNKADGSATASITANGIAPFTYSWSDGTSIVGTDSAIIDVVAGTYFVTATDSLGCFVTETVTIPNLSGPQIDSTSFTDVLCFGGNNGSATVSVSGGGFPYVYLWNDALAQSTPSATNLIAGTYVVDVTDTNGCNLSTSIVVSEPTQLVLNSAGVNPTCFGSSDGQVWVNALGGVMPYSYSWNDPLTQANDTAINLPTMGGGYTVTVTDNNGCIGTANVVLTDPAIFTINVNGTDVSCFGGNDGSAVVTENNGVFPYTYLWNDPSTQSTQTATGLIANTYNVIVRDDNDCIANGSITINEPAELTIVQDTILDVSCNGGSDGFGSVTVNGGTGLYVFTWELGTTLVSTLQSPNTLTAGTYLVTVTDDNLCSASMFITVNEPTPLTSTYVAVDPLCAGDNTGYAFVSPTGGIAPYSYQWDAAAALQQTDTATNLTAGTYGVVITDDNGCPYPINGIVIGDPFPLNLVGNTVSSTCGDDNGEASVSVGGGSGTYNFAWNTAPAQFTAIASNLFAGNYTIVVTDQNGCLDSTNVNVTDLGSPLVTIPTSTNVSCFGAANGTATADVTGGTTPYTYLWNNTNADSTLTATGLDALTYSITVTDSNGCVSSASVVIQQANALVAVIGMPPTNVSCNGGSDGAATVMVAFGNPPYTYQWNDAASQTTNIVSNLVAGTYFVIVTDSNNCTASDTVTITEPAVLMVGLDSLRNIDCFGGSDGYINVNVTGGTSPAIASYVWSPSVSAGQTAAGLIQGSYDVIVTDTKGCTATNTYVINEPTALLITMDSTASTCGNANGSAEVSSTVGGTTPYFYNWNDPANQQTALASNLSANTYNVTVIDNNGCSISSSITVNDLPGPIIDSVTKTNVICFGESNGTATVFASGTSLSYAWTPSAQITQQATGLPQGVYSVIVTDINGCTSTQGGINIAQPTAVTADINMPATACYGQVIQLFGVGGGGTPFAPPASPYNISWGAPFGITSSGALFDTVTTNTTYNIAVVDANGCTVIYPESVVVGAPLSVNSYDSTICEGDFVLLTASTTGGNTANGYTYNWFVDNAGIYTPPSGVVNPTNPANVNPITTTDYMVYVSDGCSRNDTTYVTVTVNDTSLVAFNPIAPDCPILYAEFKPVSTDIGLTYSWDFNGDGIVDQTTILDTGYYAYNTSGTYDVILSVTNANSCPSTFISPQHVTVYNVPNADFVADPQIVTILNPEINFTDLSSMDVIGLNWDFGDLTNDTIRFPTHTYQDTGYYPVQLIVTNGLCYDTIVKVVQVKPDFFFAIPNTFTPDGDDLNETFRPGTMIGVSEKEYNFYIFDRWGEKIWEGHDLGDGWNGTVKGGSKLAQTDTYVWLIKLKGIDGLHREYRGHVNILK